MLECMYEPTPHDEIDRIVGYVEQQLDAIRAAAIGLTDEQTRLRPGRSALSVGGLIKHATYGMRGVTERLSSGDGPRSAISEADFAAHEASFALSDDESATTALEAFDAARVEYVAARCDRPRSADHRRPGPVVRHLRQPPGPGPLSPGPPDRGDGPPRRPCRHHP